METTQIPEVPTSPLSRDILSAVTRIRSAAEQGRERVASKLREAKIGALGLTVGSTFFLAACAGEAKPAEFSTSLPPTTPVSEMQAPSGEPPPFELTTEPTEEELFRQNIDTLISTVRGFFHEDYFKRMGYDLDKIGDNLKNPDDTTDTTRLVRTHANSQNIDARRIIRITHRPLVFTEALPFSTSFERDTKTGEITRRHVAFYVDKNGNLLTYRENFPYSPGTKEDFDKLFDDRLPDIVRMPEDSKPGLTLRDLDWESSTSAGGFSRQTAIRGDKGTTSIALHGVEGNGLNLVSVSFFKHSNTTARK